MRILIVDFPLSKGETMLLWNLTKASINLSSLNAVWNIREKLDLRAIENE